MITAEQQRAIEHVNGPLLVIAGPGAGKTRVIVEKCVYLVREKGIKSENILVTTFTNKARDELYDRLYGDLGSDAQRITISTIHSFCQNLLSTYPAQNSIGAHFEVLDSEEQFLLVYDNLKNLGISTFPKTRVVDFIHSVISTFNLCTEESVDPDQFITEVRENGNDLLELKTKSDDAVEEYCAVAEAYKKYKELLLADRLLDFPTVIEFAYKMLKAHPDVTKELSEKYKYILIDEYQDTNRLQVLIFKEISNPQHNLCAVGDDDQSIYRFRGANVRSFLEFQQDFPGADEITLTANFRSTPAIVDATTSLIEKNTPEHKPKVLISFRDDLSVLPLNVHQTTASEEALAVITTLESWKRKNIISSWNEVVILFRSVKSHSEPYLTLLRKNEIPFVVYGEGALFEREDISKIRDLLRFCSYTNKCPLDGIRPPLFLFSQKTLKFLEGWKADPSEWEKDEILGSESVPEDEKQILIRLSQMRKHALAGEYRHHLLGLFYDLLDVSEYFRRVIAQYDEKQDSCSESTLMNLAIFSKLIDQFQRRTRSGNLYKLNEYLYYIKDNVVDVAEIEPCGEAIRVMTVHQAKGLEFPIVIIGGAMEQRFPSGYRKSKYPVPPELKISKNRDDDQTHLRDERRLFYVGMTRAEDIILIGSADKVNVRGSGPSRFLSDIKKDGIIRSVKDITDRPHKNMEKIKAPIWKRLSYSGLHSYLLCPLQYKLIYECDFSVPQIYWAYFGAAVHSCLEQVHRKALIYQITSLQELEQLWRVIWNPPENWDEERKKTMNTTGLKFLQRYITNYAERLKHIYWVEEPIEIPMPDLDLVITGRLDLACKLDGGIDIIDFKIRKRTGLQVMREELQVQLYALAAEKMRGEHVNAVTVHLLGEDPGNEIQQFLWNDGIKENIEKLIIEAGTGIKNRKFNSQPGIHCRFCDFRSLCPFSAAPIKKGEIFNEITMASEAEKIG
jgi:DNA helicase-2/ATP-dependent DNA helicase PcrA